jgi:hypothetical protein
MVNPRKYTPILKWKAAEMGALRELSDAQRDGGLAAGCLNKLRFLFGR